VRPAAWRVGLFTLAGLALLALAVVVVGGRWLAASERAVMRFENSVFGLQVGAPVVFRGVRLGQVGAIGLAPTVDDAVAIPVTVEFDRALLRDLLGAAEPPPESTVAALVARGLVARLAMQSLLTGQLYVDLDLDAARAAAPAGIASVPGRPHEAAAAGLPVIPTAPTRLQTLQAQLEGLDLAQVGRDLAAVATLSRRLLEGPDAARVLARTADAAQALERLVLRLEREVEPLSRSARDTLAESQRAMQALGQGALQVAQAASQAQQQVQALGAAGVPMAAEVERSAAELGRAAAALREAAAEDSALRLHADRALQDVARAARALRELGELIERHPDALLRGREAAP
jgi:paraquat-inducible protein B